MPPTAGRADSVGVSAEEIDEYLSGVEEPKRSTLQTLRCTILEILPEAEDGISYRVPAFRLGGTTVAGCAAFNDHPSYLPLSRLGLGAARRRVARLHDDQELAALPVDRPLPKQFVEKLIAVRFAEHAERGRR